VYRSNAALVEGIAERAPFFLDGRPRSPRVLEAMREVDRALLLPPHSRDFAYRDAPVDIGEGQTCSQPSLVAFMLDILCLEPGLRLLEIGAGCGYATAIAARLCRPGGVVLAVEIRPELASLCRANCAALSEIVEVITRDGSEGLPDREPFDRILVSAGVSPRRFREAPLLDRLAEGGVLVYPEARGDLHRLERRGGTIARMSWSGVAFVPLVGRNA
jgi:protein-L-isoaspartate(D-aspartate) O-methyltransferase